MGETTEAKKRIEFTEPVKAGLNEYEEGDRVSLPIALAKEYIRLGWAKDAATGETGERVPGVQPLQVDNTEQVIG